jgi:hypothetical protein
MGSSTRRESSAVALCMALLAPVLLLGNKHKPGFLKLLG